jgi:hypothetical protein
VVGNAKIEGMTEDLELKGIQYNIVVAIFFIPFVLCGKFVDGLEAEEPSD